MKEGFNPLVSALKSRKQEPRQDTPPVRSVEISTEEVPALGLHKVGDSVRIIVDGRITSKSDSQASVEIVSVKPADLNIKNQGMNDRIITTQESHS